MVKSSYLRRQIALVCALTFLATDSPFAAAENLPVTPAETLAGQKLEFPTAIVGKSSVCVFGFTKEAGDRTKAWMARLNQDGMNSWSIANLEGAPALVRGMIRSSMRKGTPAPLLERSLILTKDEGLETRSGSETGQPTCGSFARRDRECPLDIPRFVRRRTLSRAEEQT
jgi:hypothetical protein